MGQSLDSVSSHQKKMASTLLKKRKKQPLQLIGYCSMKPCARQLLLHAEPNLAIEI